MIVTKTLQKVTKNIRNLAVSELRNSKKNYLDKLDELLSTSTTDSKIFWKTAKQFLNLWKSSTSKPTLKLNDYYAEDDLQKANLLNTYFISQSNVIDDNKSLPELEPTQHSLNVIQITCQDVRDVLRNLNVFKSCGLLKFHFLFFLMLFSCIHKPDVSSLLHFSLILALQRSNEISKTIRTNHPRTYKLAPYSKNTYFTHSLISFIFAIDLVLWNFYSHSSVW